MAFACIHSDDQTQYGRQQQSHQVRGEPMAFAHVHFNDQTQYGRQLRRALQMMEESDDLIKDVRDLMIQMRDGDGSLAVHYAECTARFGFVSDAQAKAAFDEIDSAYSKTSGDGSVSNVRAARDQLFARLRG